MLVLINVERLEVQEAVLKSLENKVKNISFVWKQMTENKR